MKTMTTALLASTLLLSLPGCDTEERESAPPQVERAAVMLTPIGDSGVQGTVQFARTADGVHVTGRITGLTPGQHGFHVHEFGDVSDTRAGKSAGGHFAPRRLPHGRRTAEKRHVGDLGNINADDQGVATIDFTDSTIALSGAHMILGRALVVHAQVDKFTQPSGEAGERVAFGVIGIAKPAGDS